MEGHYSRYVGCCISQEILIESLFVSDNLVELRDIVFIIEKLRSFASQVIYLSIGRLSKDEVGNEGLRHGLEEYI